MSVHTGQTIAARLEEIRERIARAARRAGRAPEEVLLVGACKHQPVERLAEAVEAGLRCFGENRLQDCQHHQAGLQRLGLDEGLRWHFIGTLQRNKARKVAGHCELIHSLDRLSLAQHLDRLGRERGRPIRCLVEINLASEPTKAGRPPDELEAFLLALRPMEGLVVEGLMAIPPPRQSVEASRRDFRALRRLRDRASREGWTTGPLRHLSMGMSGDFEAAVGEGATMVRIGTALFGPRPNQEA